MGLTQLKSLVAPNVKSIGIGDFIKSLSKVLNPGRENGIKARKIGLAISGGVDSMALALLCSRLQNISADQLSQLPEDAGSRLKEFQGINFQAFVVDHGVRDGSYEEAQSVAKFLEQRDIPTKVLQINWKELSPGQSPNFESLARRYRFQTLGTACRAYGLNALLLAHHQDDQAETVFMRMANGHRMLGLTGIKGDSEIPECNGLHGVHESGGSADSGLPTPANLVLEKAGLGNQIPMEHGGVRVYRPLLDFPKASLTATCQAAEMPWFEDSTNKDPTLTMRNAVRHMYTSHQMPVALSKPAILALSQRCRGQAGERMAMVNEWLQKCSIWRFDTRVGVVGVNILDTRLRAEEIRISERRHVARSSLRRVIMLVTPEEHVELSSLDLAVERIFPELFQGEKNEEISSNSSKGPLTFTVAGVLFQPQPKHTSRSWLLSRQLPPSSLSKQPTATFPRSKASQNWSPWLLYDNRYWVRVHNPENHTITVRPFDKSDLQSFSTKVGKERLRADLKMLAPGDSVRWTLPAVVKNGEVVGLPTLGYSVEEVRERWEVRYKKVDLDGFRFNQK